MPRGMSRFFLHRLWPIAHLKEIKDREGQFAGIWVTIFVELHFGNTEGVVGVSEDFEHGSQRVQAARKTAAIGGLCDGLTIPAIITELFT